MASGRDKPQSIKSRATCQITSEIMDRILREAMEMTGGGLHVEYTTSGGTVPYRDKTPLTTCIQNAQYADDLTLVAREQKGAAAEARCPRLSLYPMGNEDQWGQD